MPDASTGERLEPAIEPSQVSICPTCQRPNASSKLRCSYCLADLSRAEPVSADRAALALARHQRSITEDARRARVIRRIRLITSVVGLLLVSYWVYAHYVRPPSPLPAPRSTSISAIQSAGTWPNADGGLERQRRSVSPSRIAAPEAWRIELPAGAETELVADEQRLYLSLADGSFVAYAIRDGSEVWRRQHPSFLLAAPAIANGVVYVPVRDGRLQALDAVSGDLIWEAAAGELLTTSPLVADGIVYLFGQNEWFGFDAETGAELWRRGIDVGWATVQQEFRSPVLTEDHVAVAIGERLLVFDRLSGERSYWYNGVAFPTRIAFEDRALFALSPWQSFAVEEGSRRPWWDGIRRAWVQFEVWGMAPAVPPPPRLWAQLRPPRGYLAPAIGPDLLYVLGTRGSLVAQSKLDGSTVWELSVPAATTAPLLAADGLLIAAGGSLLLLDPESGRELARRPIEQPLDSAVVTDHGSYFVLESTTIMALR